MKEHQQKLIVHPKLPDELEKLKNIKVPDFPLHLAKRGRELYKKNQLLRDVATFMEQPENYFFYKKYMCDTDRFHNILILLRLYEIISRCVDENMNGYYKIFILYYLLKHPTYGSIIRRISSSPLQLLN